MTDSGLPPDLPGEARPNYGAQPYRGPQSPPPGDSQPAAPPPPSYAQQAYTPPVYPPVKQGMSTGAKVGLISGLGCLVLIVIPVIVVAVIGLASTVSSLGDDGGYDPWSPTTSDDGATSSGNTAGVIESAWKSGDDWLIDPESDDEPTPFVAGYDTPEDWLNYNMGSAYSFSVVFIADPQYNCGMAGVDPQPDSVIGCYNPDYGDSLFVWWGDEATDDRKILGLLHEYSHFWQYWENFDATQSAIDAGLLDDPEFVSEVFETDATCRVYVDWHYTELRELDSETPWPCGDTGWGEHWFENELLERGVRITDY